jgi:predicted nucleic acid-binding protein
MAISVGDVVFVDTNVFLGATDQSRPCHRRAHRLLSIAGPRGYHLAMSGQIAREYLVVATRPVAQNGLGLATLDALANVQQFRQRVILCPETERVAARLLDLVRQHSLSGKRIHDANVVATMVAQGIGALVSENVDDFDEFDEIEVIDTVALSTILDR